MGAARRIGAVAAACLLGGACGLVPARTTPSPSAVTAPDCAAVAAGLASSPPNQYATVVLDGRVIRARARAIISGGDGGIETLDTVPELNAIRPEDVQEVSILKGDLSRVYEPCPGVAVVVITTRAGRAGRP